MMIDNFFFCFRRRRKQPVVEGGAARKTIKMDVKKILTIADVQEFIENYPVRKLKTLRKVTAEAAELFL